MSFGRPATGTTSVSAAYSANPAAGDRQNERIVDNVGDYYAFCPYASRVPYEIVADAADAQSSFRSAPPGENRRAPGQRYSGARCGVCCKYASSYHMVLHTAPNTLQTKGELSDYWRTIAGDYHWHIEILPIVETRSKSYSIKEVYFNGTPSRTGRRATAGFDPGKMMAPNLRGRWAPSARRDFLPASVSDFVRCPAFSRLHGAASSARLAGSFWVVDETPQTSDAIVMLGDDNLRVTVPTRAAELFKAGMAPRVVASGRYLRPYASIAELEAARPNGSWRSRRMPSFASSTMRENTREEAAAIAQLHFRRGVEADSAGDIELPHTAGALHLPANFSAGHDPAGGLRAGLRIQSRQLVAQRTGLKIFGHEAVGMIVAMWEMRHSEVQTSSALGYPAGRTVAASYHGGHTPRLQLIDAVL